MNIKTIHRLSVDAVMLIITIFLMAYTLAGNKLHEVLGILFFVFYFLHQALNLKWYKSLLRGNYTFRRGINTAVDVALFLMVLVLIVSGVMISQSAVSFLNFGSVTVGRTLHTISSHWYFIVMSIHLGLHLEMIFTVFMQLCGKKKSMKMINTFLKILSVCAAIWGIIAFISRGIWEKLILYSSFPFFNDNDNWVSVFVDYGAVIWLFGIITYEGKRYVSNSN